MKKAVLLLAFYIPVIALPMAGLPLAYAQTNRLPVSIMPSVEAVKNKIKASNSYTTSVKQAGAFDQLRLILKAIDGERTNSLSADEKRVDEAYASAYTQLVSKAKLPSRSSSGYLRNERVKQLTHYSMSRSYRDELYTTFFDKKVKDRVEGLVQEQLIYGNRTIDQVKQQVAEDEEKEDDSRRPFQKEIKWATPACLVSLGWFLWAMYLERKKRNPKNDLFTIYSGQREYTIHSFTGEVVSKESTIENRSYLQGNNQTGYRTTNYRYQHDTFFVREDSGQEHSMHLIDSGIMVRPGNTLSALWAIKKGEDTGDYFFVYNHDTKRETILTKEVNKIFRVSPAVITTLAILLYTFPIVLFHYGASFINKLIEGSGSTMMLFFSLFYPLKFNISLSFILVIIFLGVKVFIQARRKRLFFNSRLPQLVAVLKKRIS